MKNTKIDKLLKDRRSKLPLGLDIGCGENKNPNYIGMDIRELDGVDIVHDVTKFPWPIPDNTFDMASAYHLMEHIPPHYTDSRVTNLIDLLLDKKVLTKAQVEKAIGEYEPSPTFFRMMNEIWRVLKVGGKLHAVQPYAGSQGDWQDPTHCNHITEATWWYFDPLAHQDGQAIGLYNIYRPKPWKIINNLYKFDGLNEVILEKRLEDKSYA